MSVARAQQEIGSREFVEWAVYEQTDPQGREREDVRAAMLALQLAWHRREAIAIATGKQPQGPPPKLEDFMPDYGGPRQKRDAKTIEMNMRVWANIHNQGLKRRHG